MYSCADRCSLKQLLFLLFALLSLTSLQAQFSIGWNVVQFGFSGARQQASFLPPDTIQITPKRWAFSAGSSINGAYALRNWEFSLGAGYTYSGWNLRYLATIDTLDALFAASFTTDSATHLYKVICDSRFISLPVGVRRYVPVGDGNILHFMFGLHATPAFAIERNVSPRFFQYNSAFLFTFRQEVAASQELEAATLDYFLSKSARFTLDARLEAGIRIWLKKQRFALDASLSHNQQVAAYHQQLHPARGFSIATGLRYYFGKPASGGAAGR